MMAHFTLTILWCSEIIIAGFHTAMRHPFISTIDDFRPISANFSLVRPRFMMYGLSGSQADPFIRPGLWVDLDKV